MGAKVEESDSGLLARLQSRHHLGCSFATPEWGWLISKLAHVGLPCSREAGFPQSKRSGKEGESKMEAESSYPISAVTAPPCLPCSVWEKWVQLPPGGRGLYTGRTTRRWGSLGPSQRPPTHSCLLQDNTCTSIKTALTVCSLTRLHFSLVLTLMLYSVSICLSSNSTWTSTSRRQGLFTCLPLYPQHSKLGQAGSRLSFMLSQWTNDCVHMCLECEWAQLPRQGGKAVIALTRPCTLTSWHLQTQPGQWQAPRRKGILNKQGSRPILWFPREEGLRREYHGAAQWRWPCLVTLLSDVFSARALGTDLPHHLSRGTFGIFPPVGIKHSNE